MASVGSNASPPEDVHARLRRFWDADAATYDRSLSHGLGHPSVVAAWRAVLAEHLPPAPARILDVGAGTGAMSLLAAELGHRVTALDISPGMLGHAERKAAEQGVTLETVIGPADAPPEGPFDAVIERHLLWTLPDPAGAMAGWREVAPGGRLLLLEGFWGRTDPLVRARRAVAGRVRRALGAGRDHHGEYEPDLLASLPLAGGTNPEQLLDAASEAGWRRLRVERLRDVEWAYRLARGPVLGQLEAVPLFTVVGEG